MLGPGQYNLSLPSGLSATLKGRHPVKEDAFQPGPGKQNNRNDQKKKTKHIQIQKTIQKHAQTLQN